MSLNDSSENVLTNDLLYQLIVCQLNQDGKSGLARQLCLKRKWAYSEHKSDQLKMVFAMTLPLDDADSFEASYYAMIISQLMINEYYDVAAELFKIWSVEDTYWNMPHQLSYPDDFSPTSLLMETIAKNLGRKCITDDSLILVEDDLEISMEKTLNDLGAQLGRNKMMNIEQEQINLLGSKKLYDRVKDFRHPDIVEDNKRMDMIEAHFVKEHFKLFNWRLNFLQNIFPDDDLRSEDYYQDNSPLLRLITSDFDKKVSHAVATGINLSFSLRPFFYEYCYEGLAHPARLSFHEEFLKQDSRNGENVNAGVRTEFQQTLRNGATFDRVEVALHYVAALYQSQPFKLEVYAMKKVLENLDGSKQCLMDARMPDFPGFELPLALIKDSLKEKPSPCRCPIAKLGLPMELHIKAHCVSTILDY